MIGEKPDHLTPWLGGYALAFGLAGPTSAFHTIALALGLLITIYLLLGPLFRRPNQ